MGDGKKHQVATISLVIDDDEFKLFVETNTSWSPEVVRLVVNAADECAKSWRANKITEESND